MGESVIEFAHQLVCRILLELKVCHEKGEKNNLVINKSWNILRQLLEFSSFMPVFEQELENTFKPLFEFITDPATVEFEDDIVLSIKSFIKKTKKVSTVMWTIFPHLGKVFTKNNDSFGNLLECFNMYLIYGKETLASKPEWL